MPSLQGIVGALKRTDSQNKNADQEAGAQSARGPNNKPVQLANMKAASKPPKFTLSGLTAGIKNKLGSGADSAQQAKNKAKAAQKKADTSSSEETSEDLTNIIPNTLREQGPGSADNKPFLLKIEYLERENRSLQSKLNY